MSPEAIAEPTRGGSRRAFAAALGAAVVFAAATLAARRQLAPDGVGTDDAFIFLRYARNLAAGSGFVWNPGGEAVEGVSSLGWTLAATLPFLARLPAGIVLPLVSIVLVAAALGCWIVRACALRAAPAALLAGGAVALLLVARPPFVVWSFLSQMEGGLWSAALLFAAATATSALRPEAGGGTLSRAVAGQALLAVARPESLLVAPLLLAALAIAAPRPGLRRLGIVAAAAVAAQLALLVFRLAVFGWPLPNTYYAKIGAGLVGRLAAGWSYLRSAAAADPVDSLIAAAAVVACAVALARRRRPPAPLAVSAAMLAAGAAVAVHAGGDYFAGARWLEPYRPFAATLLVAAMAGAAGRLATRAGARASLAAVTILAVALAFHFSDQPRWTDLARSSLHRVDFETARAGLDLGERLNRLFPDDPPRLGVLAAGALPFAYEGPSRDMLGLNDPAMAHASRIRRGLHGHSAFSADALFADPPELLAVGPRECADLASDRKHRALAFRVALAGVDRDPRFGAAYERVRFADPPGGAPLCLWGRRDWLAGRGGWEALR